MSAAAAARKRLVDCRLPTLAKLSRDERTAVAAVRFRSASGERFGAFALDIEATVADCERLR